MMTMMMMLMTVNTQFSIFCLPIFSLRTLKGIHRDTSTFFPLGAKRVSDIKGRT